MRQKKEISKSEIEFAIQQTNSMQSAARFLKIAYATFSDRAKIYGLFVPNSSGRGTQKPRKYKSKKDVFKKDLFVPSAILRKWYFRDHEYKCIGCGIINWNDKPITLEIDHINGDRLDNRENNLRVLCPNCHSLTDSFRSSNYHKYKNGSPTGYRKSYLKLG
jgi:hypothetical protein